MVHRRWAIADVKELHHARFLLRPSALKIFMLDRSNALLNFPTNKACLCHNTSFKDATGPNY